MTYAVGILVEDRPVMLAYFHTLRERWSYALRKADMDIPRPPYGPE